MSASHKEISNILEAIAATEKDIPLALATVVEVEGSSYRRCGARMLIRQNGNWIGAISGGCLEGNALRLARQVMLDKQPRLVTYDSRTDAAAKEIGASLGCNGLIKVWIEPLESLGAVELLKQLKKGFGGNEELWFARVIENELPPATENAANFACGKSFLLSEGDFGTPLVNQLLAREEGLQEIRINGSTCLFAVEQLRPAIHLMIFGGGYDAEPVSRMAKELGWRVTVTDDCAAKALPLRFPKADQVLHLDRKEAVKGLKPDAYTAALLISHNYEYDLQILQDLQQFSLPYIGILGPKKRFERMDEEMEGALSGSPHIYGPVGLDIGAETPLEIAFSIIGEIQAVFNGRKGGLLKERKGFIHDRKALRI